MSKWLGTAKVAERIGATPRQVRERFALLPDFPIPMRPGGNGHPKWRADEIDAWCEAQRPKSGKQSAPQSPGNKSSATGGRGVPQSEPA